MVEILGLDKLLLYLILKTSLLTGGGVNINESVVINPDMKSGTVSVAFDLDAAEAHIKKSGGGKQADSLMREAYLWMGRQCEQRREILSDIDGISDVEMEDNEAKRQLQLRFAFNALAALNKAMAEIYSSETPYVLKSESGLCFGGGNVIINSEMSDQLAQEFEPEEFTNDAVTRDAELLMGYMSTPGMYTDYRQSIQLKDRKFELEPGLFAEDGIKKKCLGKQIVSEFNIDNLLSAEGIEADDACEGGFQFKAVLR